VNTAAEAQPNLEGNTVAKLTRENFNQLPLSPTDGAWGTELMKLGGASSELKELWNVSAPDKVLQVARSYVEAGARIILTNTFSANRIVLDRHGRQDARLNCLVLEQPSHARPPVTRHWFSAP
jgi:methionine synthase I (cobalamin-dependent)